MRRYSMRFASRNAAVAQLRARLEAGSFPRVQMMLLVALTGASGFLASFLLLVLGVEAMGQRYLLACCAAYACFLGLLWIWIRWRRDEDALELTDFSGFPDGDGAGRSWEGAGGDSGGAGASASYEVSAEPMPSGPVMSALDARDYRSSSSGEGADFGDLGDAAAVPVLLALAVLGLLLSSLFVVWTAPVLFAELLLDGVLAAGLYRRLRHIQTRHWLETAVRKTFWPFALTAAVLATAGFGVQRVVPHADSVGDVLPHLDRLLR